MKRITCLLVLVLLCNVRTFKLPSFDVHHRLSFALQVASEERPTRARDQHHQQQHNHRRQQPQQQQQHQRSYQRRQQEDELPQYELQESSVQRPRRAGDGYKRLPYNPTQKYKESRYTPAKKRMRSNNAHAPSSYISINPGIIRNAVTFVRQGSFDRAIEEIQKPDGTTRSQRSTKQYNQLLKELGNSGKFNHCAQVLAIMKQQGFKPTIVTYSTLISRAAAGVKIKFAERYFDEMVASGIKADVQAYNSLINAYSKASETQKAFKILDVMESENVKPTIITYNTLLDSCARSATKDSLRRALGLLATIKKSGLRPDELTYASIVHVCCQCGNIDAAFEIIDAMTKEGIRPSKASYTYSSLLHACGKSGNLERAFEVLSKMRDEGIPANFVTLSSLIDACCKNARLDLAFAVHKEMLESSDVDMRPNSITYSTLIDTCLKMGHVDVAFSLVQDMKALNLDLTEVTYTSLFSELNRLARVDRIEELWDIVKGKGHFTLPDKLVTKSEAENTSSVEDAKGSASDVDFAGRRDLTKHFTGTDRQHGGLGAATDDDVDSGDDEHDRHARGRIDSINDKDTVDGVGAGRIESIESLEVSSPALQRGVKALRIDIDTLRGDRAEGRGTSSVEGYDDGNTGGIRVNPNRNSKPNKHSGDDEMSAELDALYTEGRGSKRVGKSAGVQRGRELGASATEASDAPPIEMEMAVESGEEKFSQHDSKGLSKRDTLLLSDVIPSQAIQLEGPFMLLSYVPGHVADVPGPAAAAASGPGGSAEGGGRARTNAHVDRSGETVDMSVANTPAVPQAPDSPIPNPKSEDVDGVAVTAAYPSAQMVDRERGERVGYPSAKSEYEAMKAQGRPAKPYVYHSLMKSLYAESMAAEKMESTPGSSFPSRPQSSQSLSSTSPSSPSSPSSPLSARHRSSENGRMISRKDNLFRLYLVFQEMRNAGIQPDLAAYNTLINACASAGDLEQAQQTVRDMQEEGVNPDVITYTSLIKACGIQGGPDCARMAEEIFSQMQQRTNHFSSYTKPTELTFQRLMQAHLRAGLLQAHVSGPQAIAGTHESLSLDMGNATDGEAHKDAHRSSDVSSDTVAPGHHSHTVNTKRIFELMSDMRRQGIQPGKSVFRYCVHAALLEDDVDTALALLIAIRTNTRAGFDYKSWTAVASACVSKNKYEEADKLNREIADRKTGGSGP